MEIVNYNGDLLTSKAELLLHQVNCKGVMGSGVAKAIRDKWPIVYEKYRSFYEKEVEQNKKPTSALLGLVLPVSISSTQKVMNLFGEDCYGYDGKRHTSYDAIYDCLEKTASYCVEKNVKTIALPYKMSSDRGGADWNVIMAMVESTFKNTDVTVEIWKL